MMPGRVWWQRSSVVRRSVLIGVGWLAAAVVAVVVAIEVLTMVGGGLTRSSTPPLSRAEVARELEAHRTSGPGSPQSAPAPASVAPKPSRSPVAVTSRTPARTTTKTLASTGGTVVARCAGDVAELLSWSPAQGYLATAVSRGPAAVASVTFRASATATSEKSEEDDETAWVVTVTCFNGVPQANVAKSEDD